METEGMGATHKLSWCFIARAVWTSGRPSSASFDALLLASTTAAFARMASAAASPDSGSTWARGSLPPNHASNQPCSPDFLVSLCDARLLPRLASSPPKSPSKTIVKPKQACSRRQPITAVLTSTWIFYSFLCGNVSSFFIDLPNGRAVPLSALWRCPPQSTHTIAAHLIPSRLVHPALVDGEHKMIAMCGNPEGDVLQDLQHAESVHEEDRRWRDHTLKRHPTLLVPAMPRKPRSSELLRFAESQVQAVNGGWRTALRDPEAAAAMRAVRRRVLKLTDFEAKPQTAPTLAKDWSHRVLNGHQIRSGQPPPRQLLLRTSLEHPLAYIEHCKGWKPEVPRWPGRTLPFSPPASTSLWCEGFARAANLKPLDTSVRYESRSTRSYPQLLAGAQRLAGEE